MNSRSVPLPLTGVRVLDLGHVFQGPYATFLMAMAGADVIKIEAPHADMSRRRGRDGDYPFRALNGCKRGIVLDLKIERGRELLFQAMGGLMSTTVERDGRPLKAGAPVADFMSGAHLYGAIMTALLERSRTGVI